jgi:hypothetical protein
MKEKEMSKIRNIQEKAISLLPNGLRKSALVTLAILVCAALSAGVLARFGVIGAQSQSSAVVAHLGSEGFTPPETTRAAGTFTLTIEREKARAHRSFSSSVTASKQSCGSSRCR